MNYIILVMRSALIVVCIETAVRYAIWWIKVGPQVRRPWPAFFQVLLKGDENGILAPLMLGIAVAQTGIALRHLDVFYYTEHIGSLFWMSIILASDALMLGGTILHLIPAWEMSPAALNSSIRQAMILRLALVAAICVTIIALEAMYPLGIV